MECCVSVNQGVNEVSIKGIDQGYQIIMEKKINKGIYQHSTADTQCFL